MRRRWTHSSEWVIQTKKQALLLTEVLCAMSWAELSLTFARQRCDCGFERLARQICSSCGRKPDPREVDVKLQRRMAASKKALDILHSSTPVPATTALLDDVANMRIEPLVREMFIAAQEATKSQPDKERRLLELAESMAKMRALTLTSADLRPTVGLMQEARQTLAALTALFEEVLNALAIEDPMMQRPAENRLTQRLNAVAGAYVGFANFLEGINIDLQQADPVAELLMKRFEDVNGDWHVMSERGNTIVHSYFNCYLSEQNAAQVFVMDRLIGVFGNRDVFWSLVEDHVNVLRAAPHFATVTSMQQFGEDVAEYQHDLWADAMRAVRSQDALTLREEASDLLSSGQRVMESAARRLFAATLSSIEKKGNYSGRCKNDFGQVLVRDANNHGWACAKAFAVDIRNAKAHNDYRIVGSDVELCPTRSPHNRTLSIPNLRDEVLQAFEATMAMHLSFIIACEIQNIEMPTGLETLPWSSVIGQMLSLFGWSGVEVSQHGADLTVKASVASIVPLSSSVFILGLLPEDVHTVTYHISSTDHHERSVIVDVDVNEWRHFQQLDGDEFAKMGQYLKFMSKSHVDGTSIMSKRLASRWAVSVAIRAILPAAGLTSSEITARIALASEVIRGCELDEAVPHIKSIKRWRRLSLLGEATEKDVPMEASDFADNAGGEQLEILFDPSVAARANTTS